MKVVYSLISFLISSRNIVLELVWSLVLVALVSVFSMAQTIEEDSLRAIIRIHENDHTSFQAYKRLAELNEKTNVAKAISYYRHVISLPFHLEYSRDFVNTYNALGELYHVVGNYDSSFFMHRKALSLARKFNLENEIGNAHQGIGLNFLRLSQMDSARHYFSQALQIFGSLNEAHLTAGIYINLGNILVEEANYSEALDQFIKAEKLYERPTQDKAGLSKVLCNLGNIEFILGNFDKALNYSKRGIQLSEEIDNYLNVAYCHRLNGRIFRKLNKPDSAIDEYTKANEIYTKRGDLRNQSETIHSLGNIYYDMKRYQQALTQYNKGLALARTIANPGSMAYAYSGIGYAWYELKDFKKAIAYFDSSMTVSKKTKNFYLVMDAYQVISDIHKEQSRFKEALAYHHLYVTLKDSLNEEESKAHARDLEIKYQNEKKQIQIELLQKERQLKDVAIQKSRIVQVAMAAALLIVVAIGGIVINRNRLVNKTKRELEIERVRNALARDLHDDIGSALSSITIMSQLAGSSSEYATRIMEQSTRMQESMADIVWSINPLNDSIEKMVIKMREFASEILEPKNINYQFEESAITEAAISIERRKNIFLIFKEALNNAAKYSEASLIQIQLRAAANEITMIIKDNGKGFEVDNTKKGNGLKNMQARSIAIEGRLAIHSKNGQGTSIELKVPLT